MMKHRSFKLNPCRRESGFSLIEVLVALLVLSIGLHDAYVRTQATNLAYDIVDRMRVNNTALAAYTAGPAPPFVCDPTDPSVAMDLECWYDGLARALPGGTGVIAANATANFYDVTVQWIDRTPRDFGGAVRAPRTAADCALVAGRFWNGTNCLVQQTWTVWP
jgi:type IV pilus assembly protein PilV